MTAPEADGWDELERLAKAAEDARQAFNAATRGSEEWAQRSWQIGNAVTAMQEEMPAGRVLKLIEAARLNRGGDEGAAGVRQDNAQAGEGEAPFGYAYRYPWRGDDTVIRFDTGGREINGSRPIETIPLYTRPTPATPEGEEPVTEAYRFDAEIEWLREAARYFDKRPTRGEDSAHWANVYNAENAAKLADRLSALQPQAQQLAALSPDTTRTGGES